jgi:hypothetical protein
MKRSDDVAVSNAPVNVRRHQDEIASTSPPSYYSYLARFVSQDEAAFFMSASRARLRILPRLFERASNNGIIQNCDSS